MVDKNDCPLQKFRFPIIMMFSAFGLAVKIYQIVLKRSVVIPADIFGVLQCFYSSSGNFIMIDFNKLLPDIETSIR